MSGMTGGGGGNLYLGVNMYNLGKGDLVRDKRDLRDIYVCMCICIYIYTMARSLSLFLCLCCVCLSVCA